MKQHKRILNYVNKHPGTTATQCSRALFPVNESQSNKYYKPATVLRTLHRLVDQQKLIRKKEPGLRKTVIAWRFYSITKKGERTI